MEARAPGILLGRDKEAPVSWAGASHLGPMDRGSRGPLASRDNKEARPGLASGQLWQAASAPLSSERAV